MLRAERTVSLSWNGEKRPIFEKNIERTNETLKKLYSENRLYPVSYHISNKVS
jgi:hypothetical protein